VQRKAASGRGNGTTVWTALMILALLGASLGAAGCAGDGAGGGLTLATTTSTYDSGLLDALVPVFEEDTGIKVKILAQGTGQALETASRGDADVVLVHSRKREDAFVEAGDGVDRRDVMYNDFVIVGPDSDPAGIGGTSDAVAAFEGIAGAEATFVSRGDDSGTHTKERGIWAQSAVPEPGGPWYLEAGDGMGAVLRMASEKGAYTLTDRATYLALRDELHLVIHTEGDELLLNPYGVIAVNPEKHKNVNYEGATKFIEFLTSDGGQRLIAEYGVERFGQPLFFPDAK